MNLRNRLSARQLSGIRPNTRRGAAPVPKVMLYLGG